MSRIIRIDEYTLNEIEKVKAYAFAHQDGESYRKLAKSGDALPMGYNPKRVVHIHDGYRVVYSVSTLDSMKFHHLSISVEEKGKYPGIYDTEVIMDLFGMGKDLHDLENVWIEKDTRAVNLLKEIS